MRFLIVTDLHRVGGLYRELSEVVSVKRPDCLLFAGDFLDFSGTGEGQIPTDECARWIAALDVKSLVFVRGNHEDCAWFEFQDAWQATGRPLFKLHGSAIVLGAAVVVGFPCLMGDPTAFTADLPSLPASSSGWLTRVLQAHGPAMRTLWLMHEPPSGTPLSEANSPVAGNHEWRTAIERFRPILTVSGHDHQTPLGTNRWWCRIGSTTCVNVGQTQNGPLHYCVVEAEFRTNVPSLPSRMAVTAFPWKETVVVYPPRP